MSIKYSGGGGVCLLWKRWRRRSLDADIQTFCYENLIFLENFGVSVHTKANKGEEVNFVRTSCMVDSSP